MRNWTTLFPLPLSLFNTFIQASPASFYRTTCQNPHHSPFSLAVNIFIIVKPLKILIILHFMSDIVQAQSKQVKMAEENGVTTMVEATFADDPRPALDQIKVRDDFGVSASGRE